MSIRLRPIIDADLNDMFAWESDPRGIAMAAFTRPDPSDRDAFDVHYERVLGNPDNTTRAIEADGVFVGTIASFTLEGDRELTYWIDSSRWGQGLATKALDAFLDIERTRPLYGRVADYNLGSAKVLRQGRFHTGRLRPWVGQRCRRRGRREHLPARVTRWSTPPSSRRTASPT